MDLERLGTLLGIGRGLAAGDGVGPAPGEEYARLDVEREARTGVPEVVYGPGKTPGQIAELLHRLAARGGRALATRVSPEAWQELARLSPEAEYEEGAGVVILGELPPEHGRVYVAATGVPEWRVAREAAACARFMGLAVDLFTVLTFEDAVRRARADDPPDAWIIAAGDQPQLVTVIAGLTDVPVIAVPVATPSPGSAGGTAPLIVCLASCAPGVAVVNIDNGFGAAALARKIVRQHPDA